MSKEKSNITSEYEDLDYLKNLDRPLTEEEKAKLKKQEIEALAAAKAVELRAHDKKLLEEKEEDDKKEEKAKKTRRWLKIAICVELILLLLVRCSQLPLPENIREIIDIGFEDLQDPEPPKDNYEEYDKRKAMLFMSINKVPVFATGESKGNLYVENYSENVYWVYVEIYLDNEETGEKDIEKLIYRSNLLDIGQVLQYDTLDVNLPAGVYPATACFYGVDTETREYAGEGDIKITITVMNSSGNTVDLNGEWPEIGS